MDLACRIVEGRHEQHNDLEPHPDFLDDFKALQHRFELTPYLLAIELITEALEIDLDRRQQRQHLAQRFLLDKTVGDHGRLDTDGVGGDGHVAYILPEDHRLTVGCRGQACAIATRGSHQLFWREVVGLDLFRSELGELPVLTELALDIAARGRK